MTLPWFSRDLETVVHPLMPGRLYTVLAPTGTGKTLFGLNVVARILQDQQARVLVAATEETPRYYELLACRAVNVSYADLCYKRLDATKTADVGRWVDRYRASDQLHVMDDVAPTLWAILEDMKVGSGLPDLLVIDHLHCLDQQGMRLPEFLGGAVAYLSAFAARRQVAVLLLAQVNRPQTKDPLYPYRIPTINAGLGSSKIEHQADVILGLSRKLRDDIPKDVVRRLATGMLHRGESIRDYEEPNTARVTVLKHRMDDEASRRSVLLTVNRGKMQDRIALTGTDDTPDTRGDAYVEGE